MQQSVYLKVWIQQRCGRRNLANGLTRFQSRLMGRLLRRKNFQEKINLENSFQRLQILRYFPDSLSIILTGQKPGYGMHCIKSPEPWMLSIKLSTTKARQWNHGAGLLIPLAMYSHLICKWANDVPVFRDTGGMSLQLLSWDLISLSRSVRNINRN